MRNKILLILLLVTVFILGISSVRAWDHYKISERVKAQYAQVQQDRQVRLQQKAEADRAAKEAAEKKKLQESCQSLVAIYNKLTPFQRTQVVKPQCDLAQVQ